MTTTMTRDVGPTADSYVSNELRTAIDGIAATAERFRPHPGSMERGLRDGTRVNPDLLRRLARLAERFGYTTYLANLGMNDRGGFLSGRTEGWPGMEIRVHRGLTKANQVRNLMHELGHIILGHSPKNQQEYETKYYQFDWLNGENYHEEVAAELGAAAVAKVAGLTDGWYSVDYLATKLRGRRITQADKDAGLLSARVLWAALNEAA